LNYKKKEEKKKKKLPILWVIKIDPTNKIEKNNNITVSANEEHLRMLSGCI